MQNVVFERGGLVTAVLWIVTVAVLALLLVPCLMQTLSACSELRERIEARDRAAPVNSSSAV